MNLVKEGEIGKSKDDTGVTRNLENIDTQDAMWQYDKRPPFRLEVLL